MYKRQDEDYLRSRIQDGMLVGAFYDEKLAGIIGQHCEGSIGMLMVAPKFLSLIHISTRREWHMQQSATDVRQ